MVTIEVKDINGTTILPSPGSKAAAGYDVVAIDDPKIVGEVGNVREIDGKQVTFYRRIDYIEYRTGLFVSPKSDGTGTHHILIHPRSSIRKYDLVLANGIGLIDNDYRGEIILCFKYIWQPDTTAMETVQVPLNDGGSEMGWEMTGRMLGAINYDKIYKKGDKIGQLVAEQDIPMNFKLVKELDQTHRGEGGFGSTDIKEPSKMLPSNPKEDEKVKSALAGLNKESIADLYQKSGGITIKKRYADEIKERNL